MNYLENYLNTIIKESSDFVNLSSDPRKFSIIFSEMKKLLGDKYGMAFGKLYNTCKKKNKTGTGRLTFDSISKSNDTYYLKAYLGDQSSMSTLSVYKDGGFNSK